MPSLHAIVAYVRGHAAAVPAGALRLANGSDLYPRRELPGRAFLQSIDGRLCVITAVPVAPTRGHGPSPIVLTVRTVEQSVLANIGDRLQLANLRTIDDGQAISGDNVYEIVDASKQPIARFAWLPQKPGAQILEFRHPLHRRCFRRLYAARGPGAALHALHRGHHRRRREPAALSRAARPAVRRAQPQFLRRTAGDGDRGGQSGGTPAAVFYIDLDHFKDVNDTLGHPVGDELIRNVTLRLSHTLRGDDLVARLGGDEFAVITAAAMDTSALQQIANRIIATLCAPYSISGHTIVIGASIGIAVIDQRAGAADIMRYADMALYRAKNEGRNRACIYDAVMDADLSQRKLVEQDLREAIENDGLKVLYQPIFNASGDKDRRRRGAGALAASDPRHDPAVGFIPIAEHSGLIIELGASVLRRACLDGKAWPGISVAVNVSPLQFRQVDFVSVVERILAETGFDPARLELELTESTLLGNVDTAEAAMLRLKALGVRLALDDFGTGYSSLLYLRRLPVRQAQDRPQLRAQHREGRRRRGDRARRGQPRPRARHEGDGGRRGDRRAAPVPARRRRAFHARLPLRPAGRAGRRSRPGSPRPASIAASKAMPQPRSQADFI